MGPSTTATRRVTAPAVAPVTLADVRLHVRADPNDTSEDGYLQGLIDAAVAMVDGQGSLGRAMITQTWAQYVSQAPGWVRLTMTPFQALTAVQYYDDAGILQDAVLADFEAWLDGDHVRVKPKEDQEWPAADTRPDAIKITYTAGFGDAATDVPPDLRHALLMMVGHWYKHREAVSDVPLSAVPMAVESLIGGHRVGWYG